MLNKMLLSGAFLFSVTAMADMPAYFNNEIDQEYEHLLIH